MGGALMARVVDDYAHLPEPEYRVLLKMAAMALDPDDGREPGRYWAGRKPLAAALRKTPNSTEEGNLRRVDKAIRALVHAKVITPQHEHAHAGKRQEYRLDGLLPCPPSQGGHPHRVGTPTGQASAYPHTVESPPPQGGPTSRDFNNTTSTPVAKDDDSTSGSRGAGRIVIVDATSTPPTDSTLPDEWGQP